MIPLAPHLTSSPLPLLLIENDPRLTGALVELLTLHGFRLKVTPDPIEAIAHLKDEVYSLVVADYRFGSPDESERLALALLEAAAPVPVGCVTGSDLPLCLRRRYAFAIRKPFTIERLLISIAPWTVPQEGDIKHAALVEFYFHNLTVRNWDALSELCTVSVQYNPPSEGPSTRTIFGRHAFRQHAEEVFRFFPDARFTLRKIFWLPNGAIAQFRSSWKGMPPVHNRDGAVLFGFDGTSIAKIGVDLEQEQFGITRP